MPPQQPGYQQFGQGAGTSPNFERFVKPAAIGGVIGGIASSIPVLNMLNMCFCLLIMVGAVAAVFMFLNEHSQEQLADTDGAIIGAMAGGIAGVIATVLNWTVGWALASVLAGIYTSLYGLLPGPMLSVMSIGFGRGILMIPVNIAINVAFGALAGFLSLQLFFKDRRKT